MARPKINANQFRNGQQQKLVASGLVTKFATLAITRLDNALQNADEGSLPVGTEITRTYTTLEPLAKFFMPGATSEVFATKELADVVLVGVKAAIADEFGKRGFNVSFDDVVVSDREPTHYVTIS